MAGVEQHINYRRELRAGDLITIRSTILEIQEKSIRFIHSMWNDETGQLAASTVLVALHIDTSLRKSCPFPAGVRERARLMIIERQDASILPAAEH